MAKRTFDDNEEIDCNIKKPRQLVVVSDNLVSLDNSVLLNCARMIHYSECIAKELVSHRIAKCFRQSYSERIISIGYSPWENGNYSMQRQVNARKLQDPDRRSFCNLHSYSDISFLAIFKRFSRFHTIYFETADDTDKVAISDFFIAIITEGCAPIKVQKLDLKWFILHSTHCELIVKLAPVIEKLKLHQIFDETVSDKYNHLYENLRRAVNECENLKYFYLDSKYFWNHHYSWSLAESRSNSKRCLKTMLMRHFTVSVRQHYFDRQDDADYHALLFANALNLTKNLRSLSIENWFSKDEILCFLAQKSMLPLIGQLHRINFGYFGEDFPTDNHEKIIGILQALPSYGQLSVCRWFYNKECQTSTLSEEDLLRLPIDVKNTLQHWMKFSEVTKRVIRLNLHFNDEHIAAYSIGKGIDSLLQVEEFSDLQIEKNIFRIGKSLHTRKCISFAPSWYTASNDYGSRFIIAQFKRFRRFDSGSLVYLEDLVLQNIAMKLHYSECIKNESVARRFTENIRATYNRRRLISVGYTQVHNKCCNKKRHKGLTRKLCDPDRCVWRSRSSQPCLDFSFLSIFKRFSYFRTFTFHTTENDTDAVTELVNAIMTSGYTPILIRKFEISSDSFSDTEKGRSLLIEKLAPAIQTLHLDCISDYSIFDEHYLENKHLWQAVSRCPHLKRLQLERLGYNNDNMDSSNDSLQCLRTLKIRHFTFSIDENFNLSDTVDCVASHAKYLSTALKLNENLRSLSVKCGRYENNADTIRCLAANSMVTLIGKLRKISFVYFKGDFPTINQEHIVRILQALPNDGQLSVCRWFPEVRVGWLDIELAVEEQKVLLADVKNTLQYWLKFSEITNRVIRLNLHFEKEKSAAQAIPKGIVELLKANEVSHLRINKKKAEKPGVAKFRCILMSEKEISYGNRFIIASFGESLERGESLVMI